MKGKRKEETKEYWCEICGAACDEITEETFPDLRNARVLCPECKKSYDEACRLR
jgi:uncharacterized CHY-type Zn-finger protein